MWLFLLIAVPFGFYLVSTTQTRVIFIYSKETIHIQVKPSISNHKGSIRETVLLPRPFSSLSLTVIFFSLEDEDIYTFFEPDLPCDTMGAPRTRISDAIKPPGERRPLVKLQANRGGSKSSHNKKANNNNNHNHMGGTGRRPSPEKNSWSVLDLKGENYFSGAVGRTRTTARYVLGSSDDVVAFLKELAEASVSSSPPSSEF